MNLLKTCFKGLKQILLRKVNIIAGALLLSLLLSSDALSDRFNETSFKQEFKNSVTLYMPAYDYIWLVAQCRQESSFDPYAMSPAGAEGYCQFMPDTWLDCQLKLGFVAPRSDAGKNIRCAAWYMGSRVEVWGGRNRTASEKLPLAQASYNCGTGCVLKAQKRCEDGRVFEDIVPCLPKETQEYPIKISKFYDIFVGKIRSVCYGS